MLDIKNEEFKKEAKLKKIFRYIFEDFFEDFDIKLAYAFINFLTLVIVLTLLCLIYFYTNIYIPILLVLCFSISYILANIYHNHY